MKPRLFIGSSVEGLNIAYAVQQNLVHDSEATVWDQGVFELSATTIESLTNTLSTADFAIFVFSPDDRIILRKEEKASVRDNVLFELGLFIGKLGRNRVFFIVPSNSPPHIPSDLLGITPATFDAERADRSMQAATAPACHSIRQQMKRLGPIHESPEAMPPGDPADSKEKKLGWIDDLVNEKYPEAKAKLEATITEKSGDDAVQAQAWIHLCDLKMDEKLGLEKIRIFSESNRNSIITQRWVARILRTGGYVDEAIRFLQSTDPAIQNSPEICISLSSCYKENGEHSRAIDLLSTHQNRSMPSVALALAEIYEDQELRDKALEAIQMAYFKAPRDRALAFKYARLAQDLEKHSISLFLLHKLTLEQPDSAEYWGYLGNACLSLGLHNHALLSYRRSEALLKGDDTDPWVVNNIGNLFLTKDLPSEAVGYLERGVKSGNQSEYGFERMATAMKKKASAQKDYEKSVALGQELLREAESILRAEDSTPGSADNPGPNA